MAPKKRAKSAATITVQRCLGVIVKSVYPYQKKIAYFQRSSRSWLEGTPTDTLNAAYLFFYHVTNNMWERHLAAI
jgi:hypothetical protein